MSTDPLGLAENPSLPLPATLPRNSRTYWIAPTRSIASRRMSTAMAGRTARPRPKPKASAKKKAEDPRRPV